MTHRGSHYRDMMFRPRMALASLMWIATSCTLVYDVDSITSANGECGEENASCCAGDKCNYDALSCVEKTCQRCAPTGSSQCCLAKKVAECSGDAGAVKLLGVCEGGQCTLPCSTSASSCSALSQAICCSSAAEIGCDTCTDNSCICKVCCAKCGESPYVAIQVSAGQACSARAQAYCGESYVDGRWSVTGC